MPIISKDEDRLVIALVIAENFFWGAIAANYPEALSSDLSPHESTKLSNAMRSAIIEWLQLNTGGTPVTQTAEIMLHRIEYHYHEVDDVKLSNSDEEHIAYSISQGISEGDLCTHIGAGQQAYGYWEINNNPE